jgi:hypothetical protein
MNSLSTAKNYFLVLTFVFLTSSVAMESEEHYQDGNHLLMQCQAVVDTADKPNWRDVHEAWNVGFCLGLAQGIPYGSPLVCPPAGVTNGQSVRVVVKFLNDNPEKLNLDEDELVTLALSKAFPCKHTP